MQELNLDALADAMRDQQNGKTNSKKLVWDKNTMSFVELDKYDRVTDEHSPMNDVSTRPFFVK